MAEVPFDHVEATGDVRIDGVLAFTAGDAVPVDTATRLGLGGDVIPGTGSSQADFRDPPIVTTSDPEPTPDPEGKSRTTR